MRHKVIITTISFLILVVVVGLIFVLVKSYANPVRPVEQTPMTDGFGKPQPQTDDESNQQTALNVGADGTARVIGTVLKNNHACTRDGSCYLQLRVRDQEVLVEYSPGRGSLCPNIKARRQGFGIKEGQKAEVHGAYSGGKGNQHFISTCSSEAFYILPLP